MRSRTGEDDQSNDSSSCKITRFVEEKELISLCYVDMYHFRPVENSKKIADSQQPQDELAEEQKAILAAFCKQCRTSEDLLDRAE